MTRVKFWDLFKPLPDGSIEPIKPIKIAGVQLEPGTKYPKGILFSGFDLFQYLGRDLEVKEEPNSPTLITGVY